MRKLRIALVTLAVTGLAAAPGTIASASNSHAAASNSHAGMHGNQCGLGHPKHVKGQGGLRIGQTCTKAHGGGSDG